MVDKIEELLVQNGWTPLSITANFYLYAVIPYKKWQLFQPTFSGNVFVSHDNDRPKAFIDVSSAIKWAKEQMEHIEKFGPDAAEILVATTYPNYNEGGTEILSTISGPGNYIIQFDTLADTRIVCIGPNEDQTALTIKWDMPA